MYPFALVWVPPFSKVKVTLELKALGSLGTGGATFNTESSTRGEASIEDATTTTHSNNNKHNFIIFKRFVKLKLIK